MVPGDSLRIWRVPVDPDAVEDRLAVSAEKTRYRLRFYESGFVVRVRRHGGLGVAFVGRIAAVPGGSELIGELDDRPLLRPERAVLLLLLVAAAIALAAVSYPLVAACMTAVLGTLIATAWWTRRVGRGDGPELLQWIDGAVAGLGRLEP